MDNIKNIFLTGLLAFVVCGFTACSKDDDPVEQPVLEVLSADAYDISELDQKECIVTSVKFSTNCNWHLSADKIWVLFSQTEDGTFYNDMRGTAGTHTVYMKITNDARTFESAAAMVKFVYGDNTYEYGRIYRHPLKEESNITDEDGEPLTEIDMGNDASATIKIDANYSYGIKSYPSWIAEPQILNGNYLLNVLDEHIPYALAGEFVVASFDGSVEQAYPITYNGMPPHKVEIKGDYGQWGWEVSLDGKTYRNSSTSVEGNTEETLVDNSLQYSIRCFNYDYSLLFAAEDKAGAISVVGDGWLAGEISADDKSLVTVTASTYVPTSDARQRKGYLFAVPTGVYDEFMASIGSATDAATFIDEHIDNVILEVTQKDLYAATGFDITTEAGEKVECKQLTSGDIYDWVSSELNVTEVYAFTGTPGVRYNVNTLFTDDEWYNGAFDIYDADGKVNIRRWGSPSKYKDSNGYYIIKFMIPTAGVEKNTVMRLHIDNVNKKALVILPVSN